LLRRPPSAAPNSSLSATAYSMVVTLVNTRLDYGNGALIGLPVYLTRRLQSVLNATARLIFNLRRSDHVFDALISLHWLRVPERIRLPSWCTRSSTAVHRRTLARLLTLPTY